MTKKKKNIGYRVSPLKGRWGWTSKDTSGADTTRLDELKGEFTRYDMKNLYGDVKNPYADIQTNFENVYEDLTINQKQFELQREFYQQSQATTLQKMQELGMVNVQALQNQAQTQAQTASATIGDQEAQNVRLKAQGASRVQAMEREAEMKIAQGAWTADQARRAGATDARNLELQKIQGLMAIEAGEIQSLRQAEAANRNFLQQILSDRRLKKNIELIGQSPSGINIYNFEYKNPIHGEGLYQGVMSDDIPQKAVINTGMGYDMVDYSQIDVKFRKI